MMPLRAFARAAAFAVVTLSALPAANAEAQVTSLADGRRLVIEPAATASPKGVVLLIPGGTTLLNLGPEGQTNSGNFVIRTRRMLQRAGFTIAYLDDPGDLREPIARLRSLGTPVVLLSTSRGTIVAAENAARLGAAGPDLLILTSPVTNGVDIDLRGLKIPVLVTTNDNDTCAFSPSGGAAVLAKRIGANATLMDFSSTAMTSAPCDAMSPHGYLGIESEVLAKIVAWIAASTKP